MFDIFGSLRNVVRIDKVCIDNNVFRLHYKATFILLVAFSLLVTSRQYFGDPIDCIQNDDIPTRLLDTYCWIHATFTLPNAFNKTVGVEIPAPGVDNYKKGEPRIYHMYYQWVCFVLFLQALMFYTPRYMWKMWEGGKVKTLVLGLNMPILNEKDKTDQKNSVVQYLAANLHYHNLYVFYFIVCEILNFVNVVGQMYLVDAFLGNSFTTYGIEVLQFTETDQDYRQDPMVRVFPRMTKCTFHRYGSSGDVQKHDALCILPLNIVNEKIYIFLWFWFVILAILSGIILVYRFLVILWPSARYMVLRSRARITDKMALQVVTDKCRLGDWFLIYLLCKNMDPLHFREVISDLCKELQSDEGGDRLLKNEKEV